MIAQSAGRPHDAQTGLVQLIDVRFRSCSSKITDPSRRCLWWRTCQANGVKAVEAARCLDLSGLDTHPRLATQALHLRCKCVPLLAQHHTSHPSSAQPTSPPIILLFHCSQVTLALLAVAKSRRAHLEATAPSRNDSPEATARH